MDERVEQILEGADVRQVLEQQDTTNIYLKKGGTLPIPTKLMNKLVKDMVERLSEILLKNPVKNGKVTDDNITWGDVLDLTKASPVVKEIEKQIQADYTQDDFISALAYKVSEDMGLYNKAKRLGNKKLKNQ